MFELMRRREFIVGDGTYGSEWLDMTTRTGTKVTITVCSKNPPGAPPHWETGLEDYRQYNVIVENGKVN